MPEMITVSTLLPADPETLYHAWLDSEIHSAFTGSPAVIDPNPGGRFTAWDGYISGYNIELVPGKKIVQAWRTSDFPPGDPDSLIEVQFVPQKEGTLLSIRHEYIPDEQGEDYEIGWWQSYFEPMIAYFSSLNKR